ncbi:hypothetical protein FRUB_01404 [Fimbriiglobus ruber]|uniref:Uncharacterized protein n=1 Tax=Fimbriiglobus ruber TaxID=1908690 RepID=A0A225DVN1_9BACT|nr:hypothetical protein FRUB_01404 [Fimbriiglobus ruber]
MPLADPRAGLSDGRSPCDSVRGPLIFAVLRRNPRGAPGELYARPAREDLNSF